MGHSPSTRMADWLIEPKPESYGWDVPRRVTLAQIEAGPALAGIALLRRPRLSVSPVREAEWVAVRALSEGTT